MHGTTGSVLGQIYNQGGLVIISSQSDTLKHDFGPGLYCFRGDLKKALSFAFSCAWPHLLEAKQTAEGKKKAVKDNIAIVLFPEVEFKLRSNDSFTLELINIPTAKRNRKECWVRQCTKNF